MPGSDDREPSSADRPPASRVGDELQRAADGLEEAPDPVTEGERRDIEDAALERAREKQWDQASTALEGASGPERPSPAEAERNRAEDPPA